MGADHRAFLEATLPHLDVVYLWAAKMTPSLPEQRYLQPRAARLHHPAPPASPAD